MLRALDDERMPVEYLPNMREYVLVIDGPMVDLIAHCPWCGSTLPDSLRDRFFDELDNLGLEVEDPAVPEEFRSDEWWRARNLP